MFLILVSPDHPHGSFVYTLSTHVAIFTFQLIELKLMDVEYANNFLEELIIMSNDTLCKAYQVFF